MALFYHGESVRHDVSRSARLQVRLIALLLAIAVLAWAAMLGADANWDLRNYHIYNPFALLHGKWAIDFAPAQTQTFNAPMLDIPYYLLLRRITSVPVLNMLLAIPHAISAVLAFLLALRVLGGGRALSARLSATIATLFGLTGTATLPVLATSMSDMPAVALVLGGLLVLIPKGETQAGWRRVGVAGLLGGAAAGLKLTLAPAGLGMLAAVLVLGNRQDWPARLRAVAALGAGGLVGVFGLAGWWFARLWWRYGNPIFPNFNNLFHAPLAAPVSYADLRFVPSGLGQALAYPVLLATEAVSLMSELPARDPRYAAALMACLILLGARMLGLAVARPVLALAAFFLVTFALWERQFGILRYLSMLEFLTGTLVVAAIGSLLRRFSRSSDGWLAAALLSVLFAATHVMTVYPDWGRAPRGGPPVAVILPPFRPDALVLLLDPSPMSYLAAYAPLTTRFVGAGNWLVNANNRDASPGVAVVEGIIRQHAGEIWGLETPEAMPGWAGRVLRVYGLQRLEGCMQVPSNLDSGVIRACRLGPG